jgi:hypothetical protein
MHHPHDDRDPNRVDVWEVAVSAPTAIFEGFSISHAQILNGTDTFIESAFAAYDEDLDIYGVADGSLEPDSDSYDNEGDDVVLSTWDWLNKATISLQAGYVSFPVISSITGRAMTTTGTGLTTAYAMDIWHEDDFGAAAKPMILKCPSRDSKGAARDLIIGLYKVTFGAMTFDGPAFKDGLKCNYNGTANYSGYDEAGVAFPDGKKRVGRLISVGKAAPTP